MTDSVTYQSVLSDPNWRLCALQPMRSELVFGYSNISEIEQENYIDHRYINKGQGRYVSLPMDALFELTESQSLPTTHYIFHTAFCGSTLLSRCMNVGGKSFSVREPNALMQLAEFKREQGENVYRMPVWKRLLRLVVFLLGRPYDESEIVNIKLSNSMNNMITDLMTLDSSSKALLMSSSMEQFIISNVKKDGYEAFCQQVLNCLSKDRLKFSYNQNQSLEKLNGPQMAALVWSLQKIQCEAEISHIDSSRLRFLSISEFLEKPQQSIEGLSEFWELGFMDSDISEIMNSKAFKSHSKEDRDNYDANTKQQEDQEVVNNHKEEIQMAKQWLNKLELNTDYSSSITSLV